MCVFYNRFDEYTQYTVRDKMIKKKQQKYP